ncbi:hypothetical protein K4039_08715 [Lyngbya sp. CCAP 1446/10]|uniref:hypothetical protein n=1 Tax=Lyngbya sp. CCAP 1446/10 TaxID=439293 RepID=UPI002238D56A|nr:hypothetical protein [Lyngbya sp. CCAP 1446/10]MCW6050162.1 hypothetical protein [Lyngbya sp. CCAP 1446/10]
MIPEEQQKIKINIQEIAEILYKNPPVDNLENFESVELSEARTFNPTFRTSECNM